MADDGFAVASENRERVFDRFIRLGDPDGPDGSGVGAIVRSAAARLNAMVELGGRTCGTTVLLRFRA